MYDKEFERHFALVYTSLYIMVIGVSVAIETPTEGCCPVSFY